MISLKSYLDNTKIWLSYPLGLSDITSALYLLIENVNVVIFYFHFLREEIMRISPKCLSNLSLSVFIFYFIAAKINDFSLIKTQDF